MFGFALVYFAVSGLLFWLTPLSWMWSGIVGLPTAFVAVLLLDYPLKFLYVILGGKTDPVNMTPREYKIRQKLNKW